MKVHQLFPIPMYQGRVKFHELIKDVALKNITTTNNPYGEHKAGCNVNTSYNQETDFLEKLIPYYSDNINEYFDSLGITANATMGIWFNEFQQGGFHAGHDHVPGDFSCVHFVEFDKEEHISTIFESPIGGMMHSNKVFGLLRTHATFKPEVEEGDMIIFPSFLYHAVMPQLSSKRRVTISLNIEIKEVYRNR